MHATHDQSPAIVPLPRSCVVRPGALRLASEARIIADPPFAGVGRRLAGTLRRSTGLALPVLEGGGLAPRGGIRLARESPEATLGAEGYRLSVTPEAVTIRASAPAGCVYATQTLLQLLPPEVFSPGPARASVWDIPCAEVEDAPRFAWRGCMLDTARHFFSAGEIDRFLDVLVLHKLNVLHLHLTDDQGWRIQVMEHPQLTEKAAWRDGVGFGLDPASTTAYDARGRYGGFYTQDDARSLVAAAAERAITIVPEIEMPGHSSAALAAYPSLGCTGGPYAIGDKARIYRDIYCAGREETFVFLQDVLEEVLALFPGRSVHIGGDEAPKKAWHDCSLCQERMKAEGLRDEAELQSWFIRRIASFVAEHGRTLVGWSEIREGGLAKRATLMDWIGGGLESAREGHDVVMTPTSRCYFDYGQLRKTDTVPVFPNSYLPLSQVRAFEPVPRDLEPQYHGHILGTQANLWTEYIPSISRLEYQAFPRLCALAEVAWSPAGAGRDDFDARLHDHLLRLDQKGVRYCRKIE